MKTFTINYTVEGILTFAPLFRDIIAENEREAIDIFNSTKDTKEYFCGIVRVEEIKLERYKYYYAKVKVKNKATLRPDANLNDGDIIIVSIGWMMDKDDMFPGQYAMLRKGEGYWIPEEDLIILREAE